MENKKKPMVVIVTRFGEFITLEQWQSLYGLKVGSSQIGKYFSYTEPEFQRNLDEYGSLLVNELLIRVLDRYRELKKGSVCVNSFNRDQDHQDKLTAAGLRTAKISPHVVKLAADVDTPSAKEISEDYPELDKVQVWQKVCAINREQTRLLKLAAKELDIKIRVGNEDYLANGYTFIHFDVCPEYYAPGKPYHKQKHPAVWEKVTSW